MSETFDFHHDDPRRSLVDHLRRQVGTWQASAGQEEAAFSSSVAALDRLLPGGALRHGMLVEWLGGLARGGAATLSLLCARAACRPGGVLVVLDRRQTFYPPAAAAWGIDLSRLLIVRPQTVRDELWAAVQALRSPAVAALWAEIDRLDSRAFRRLQLAAQAGRTLGLLLRSASIRGQPTWADVRFDVRPLSVVRSPLQSNHGPRTTDHGRFIQVHVLRTRSGPAGNRLTLRIDDTTHTVHEAPTQKGSRHDAHPLPLVSELAAPAASPHSARA